MGSGGLALTRTRPATVVLAEAAATQIPAAALASLVAHELGHVAYHATPRGRRRQRHWVIACTLVVLPGLVLVGIALFLAPRLGLADLAPVDVIAKP